MRPQVVLLRGINVGSNHRIAMPALREALTDAGFADQRTYVQSGNLVLDTDLAPVELTARIHGLLANRFGLDVPVVSRTRDELAAIVAHNPLRQVASDPKRYQVSFLSDRLADDVAGRLHALTVPPERLVVGDRELFAWHPEGVGRSKLWNALAGKLGVTATARNWTTVTTLLRMVDGA